MHINLLEAKAVVFGFQSLLRDMSGVSVLVRSDNSATVAYINNCGGRSPGIYEIISELYDFCMDKNIRIRATHLSGRINTRADELSRRPRDHAYSIPISLFNLICNNISFMSEVDLFASRLNHKLPLYYSAGPDPSAF